MEECKNLKGVGVKMDKNKEIPSTITINMENLVMEKVEKKAVNYYLPVTLIERIKEASKMYGKKDSNFIEEVLDQVLKSLGI